ncbi:putative glycerate kinase [Thioflavicoccus mobilis 8321]|uniref:Putative glycerate kinase n=1 Tax=Thioflavicoccus mobilis 8321 TaxID=765912 RepID=L0GVI1_9GAMM|nr:putative glycerate kinase [Thioflavicoccus mobilis 8321]
MTRRLTSVSSLQDPRGLLLELLSAGLSAVGGRRSVLGALAARPLAGSVRLVALGKAAQAMTEGAVAALGLAIRGGVVVSKAGHLDERWLASHGLEAIVGGHPVPNAGSLAAGEALRTMLAEPDGGDWLFLLSGGASSLVELPVAGLGIADLQRANGWLLASGLPIESVNLVRKALSRIKGGGLLRWVGGRCVRVLAISDVPGDDPAVIGSGPLVPEPGLAARVGALDLPAWLDDWVRRGLAERGDLPGSAPPIELVATLEQAAAGAMAAARSRGILAQRHPSFIGGDAATRGAELGRWLCGAQAGVHIWGGETTVRLPERPGRGGRNQHLALAAAGAIAGRDDCWLLAAGTDGTDGPTDVAGALVDGGTLARASGCGLTAEKALRRADAGTFLEASGDLVDTGPTGTNVMDLIIALKRG